MPLLSEDVLLSKAYSGKNCSRYLRSASFFTFDSRLLLLISAHLALSIIRSLLLRSVNTLLFLFISPFQSTMSVVPAYFSSCKLPSERHALLSFREARSMVLFPGLSSVEKTIFMLSSTLLIPVTYLRKVLEYPSPSSFSTAPNA